MRLIERRIGLVFALFLIGLGLAAGKALWLGVVRADALRGAAATQQKATLTVPARRGPITDRNGEELAVSQPATSVAATPYLITDPLGVAKKLAPLLGESEADLLASLSRKDTGFVWLARKLPASRAAKVEELGVEGIDFVEESVREYPRRFLASQLL